MGLLDDYEIPIQQSIHPRAKESQANRLLKAKKTRRGKRVKHKKKIPSMSYKMYMGSAYWKKRKLLYWNKNGKSCAICGKKQGVTLHHKRYDVKYGAEPDDALVALCMFHHHEFHKSYPLNKNMVSDTEIYVQEARLTNNQFKNSNIDDLNWIQ